jgi:hypothetical protein
VTVEHAAARFLLEALAGRELGSRAYYGWSLTAEPVSRHGDVTVAGLRAASHLTGEVVRLAVAGRRQGAFDFVAAVAPWPGATWSRFVAEAPAALADDGPPLDPWAGRYRVRVLRLQHFLPDERRAILQDLMVETDAALTTAMERLGSESLPAAEAMVRAGTPLPAWMQALLEAALSREFTRVLGALPDAAGPSRYVPLLDLADLARHLGLRLDLQPASERYGARLLARLTPLEAGGDADGWQEFLELLQIGGRLGLLLPERALQDRVFRLLGTVVPDLVSGLTDARSPAYRHVAAMLAVAARLSLRTEDLRARLRPIEEPFARDPAFWP